MVHEATHFNDCLTTAWGMEFTFRKLRLIKHIAEGHDVEQPLSVFYLNVSELRSHKELVTVGEYPLSMATSMTHTVSVDEDFGPVIYINYNMGDEVIQRTPLSLLSVFEANAVSNEILVKIIAADALSDCPEKKEYIEKINLDFETVLSDKDRSEYTVLLNLARMHFAELNLKELLVFVATLSRFALDLNDLACAEISYPIQNSINDKYAGEVICQDMRRASSRAVIFFKTLMFMHGWIKCSNYSVRTNVVKILKENPLRAILRFWDSVCNGFSETYNMGESFLFAASLGRVSELADVVDKELLQACSSYNRSILKDRPLALCHLSEVCLPDIFLSDETEINVPNRVEMSISDYLINNMEIINEAEERCKENLKKFFMRPGDNIVNVNIFDA